MSKAKLIYLVKHNAFIKNSYVILGSLFFKFLGLFIKIDPNLVLIVPNTGSTFSGSPKDIYDYMQSHDVYRDYNCVWAFNDPQKMAEQYNLRTVKFDSLSYFLTSLKAKYWITDINVERGLHYKKKETIFLNTWHGVALKKIGNDDPKSARYDYSDLDFLCVSGNYDKKVFSSALNAPESSFLECGMPRNDRLFKTTEKEKQELRQQMDIPNDKKVIIYVPTWRDSTDNGKSFGLKIQADFEKWERELSNDYVLLFRAHSRTTSLMNLEFNEFIRDYSTYPDLNDMMIVADVLITDYSSVVFDYAILGKPFICFGYDYEAYLQERGCYFDPEEEYPGGVLRTEDQVIDKLLNMDITKESQNTLFLKERFMNYTHGNATQTCVEKLFDR